MVQVRVWVRRVKVWVRFRVNVWLRFTFRARIQVKFRVQLHVWPWVQVLLLVFVYVWGRGRVWGGRTGSGVTEQGLHQPRPSPADGAEDTGQGRRLWP